MSVQIGALSTSRSTVAGADVSCVTLSVTLPKASGVARNATTTAAAATLHSMARSSLEHWQGEPTPGVERKSTFAHCLTEQGACDDESLDLARALVDLGD